MVGCKILCNYGEVYNIGGSYTISVGEFLDLLISQARVKIKSKADKNLLRPSDVTLQIPDSSKFIRKLKWKQMYSVDESIKFLLGIWRKNIIVSSLKNFYKGRKILVTGGTGLIGRPLVNKFKPWCKGSSGFTR